MADKDSTATEQAMDNDQATAAADELAREAKGAKAGKPDEADADGARAGQDEKAAAAVNLARKARRAKAEEADDKADADQAAQ